MTWGTGIPLIDGLLLLVGAFYVGRAAGTVLIGIIAFIRYRRQDGKQDHTGFRE